MRLVYDPQADVLQVRLRSARIHSSEDIEPGVVVQYDSEGHVVGIELSNARKRLTLEELTSVTYENLALQRRASLTLP
jgi:uncharacterized protein YuzE